MISDEFKVLSEVGQRGILSPVLFNLYVDDLIKELQPNPHNYVERGGKITPRPCFLLPFRNR